MRKHPVFLLFAMLTPACAQWAVLADDPRPRNPARLFEVFSKEDWNRSNFATDQDLQWFRDAKYGMFLHFGLSTFKNAELSWGVCGERKPPDTGAGPYPTAEWMAWKHEFRLPDFNAGHLVRHAQDAGMRYIVAIAKHHDGFHMWDTNLSDFKITNTPFARDYLKEIADACHKAGMKFGIYYSQRDWVHPDYDPINFQGERHQRYIKYQFDAVRELCTNYGKVDVFWFDALWWGGMFHADMWDAENLTRMIRELQPGILINNRTNLPGDFDTPEHRIGMFQNHRPWESCMTVCKTWSYSETPTKTPKEIVAMLVGTLTGDGNLLLSWGPKWSGEFATDQVESLKQAGDWVRKNEAAIFGTRGGPWHPADWGGSVFRDKTIYLHITSMPETGVLKLAGLEPRVLQAAIHGGASLAFSQDGGDLRITIPPDLHDPHCTVVELTLEATVGKTIAPTQEESIFNDPAYGRVISETANPGMIAGDHGKNPHTIIDLGKARSIRGIRIENTPGDPATRGVVVSLSPDGKAWEEIWRSQDIPDVWEIPVTRFQAGAHIPGRNARFVKIERQLDSPGPLPLRAVRVHGE
jgi:alpha-L-fucosidase